jgi:uncharacterized membrane protein
MRLRGLWLLLPEEVRRLPADLAGVLVLTALTVLAVLLPVVRETPLRALLGLPFVLFLPGYAIVAALFPEAGDRPEPEGPDGPSAASRGGDDRAATPPSGDGGIDGVERVALSVGASVAVVPLVGLTLNFTRWGVQLLPVLLALVGLTALATAIAARRRRALPAAERFRVPYRTWARSARTGLLQPDSRGEAVLNVLMVASVVLATASVGYAVAVPRQGEAFTEFYVLNERQDGRLVAEDYPRQFQSGESEPIVVGIGNHEHETVSYTVVVTLQRVRTPNASNETGVTVLEEEELGRFSNRLDANETWHHRYRIRPTLTGERLRLTLLLYRGSVPRDPTTENAHRELHLWIDVSASGDA